jgi:hypothetical protein
MRFTFLLLFASALSPGTLSPAQAPDTEQAHWAGTWGASPSPQLPDVAQMSKANLTFANQTLREIVHISIGGSLVRVRLSNAYGKQAVEIGAAHIALRQKGAAIAAGSDHVLTFSGQSSVTIPPNALVLSDPIPLQVAPSSDLAISIFLPKSTLGAGIHYSAQQTNYLAAGNVTSARDISNVLLSVPGFS